MIVEVKTHAPGHLFDANGVELLYVVWADTETGEAVHLINGDDGRFEMTHDETGRQTAAKAWRRHPAPLVYRRGRSGLTLIEVLVVLAIIATLAGLLAPAFFAASNNAPQSGTQATEPAKPSRSWFLSTEQHDGHWWIRDGGHIGFFVHHPDCPCRSKTAEAAQ